MFTIFFSANVIVQLIMLRQVQKKMILNYENFGLLRVRSTIAFFFFRVKILVWFNAGLLSHVSNANIKKKNTAI